MTASIMDQVQDLIVTHLATLSGLAGASRGPIQDARTGPFAWTRVDPAGAPDYDVGGMVERRYKLVIAFEGSDAAVLSSLMESTQSLWENSTRRAAIAALGISELRLADTPDEPFAYKRQRVVCGMEFDMLVRYAL